MSLNLPNNYNETQSAARNSSNLDVSKNNVNVNDSSLTISGSATSIWDAAKNTANNAIDGIKNILGSGNPISSVSECMPGFGDLFKIGRPVAFHPDIDPGHKIGNYLRNRMAQADILPCRFSIPFEDVLANAQSGSLELHNLLPVLNYDNAINEFKTQCGYHGLPSNFMGLRIYSTDDTSANDTFTNNYEANFIQQKADAALESKLGGVSRFFRSLGGAGEDRLIGLNKYVKDTLLPGAGSALSGAAGSIGESLGASQSTMNAVQSMGQVAGGVVSMLSDVVILGNRISLPEIWSNSDYQPRYTINVKLVSPYGHPKAVKEFIIKPWLMLLLMCAPKTNDGITYGRPWSITLKGYGMSSIPLGCISSISFRRGGGESAFNIFKQPIVVDVSIEIVSLCRGFGMHTGVDQKVEDDAGVFSGSDQPAATLQYTGKTLFHTGGHIVDSLRPKTPDAEIPSMLGMKSWAAPNGLGSSGTGSLSINSISGSLGNVLSSGNVGSVVNGVQSLGGIISTGINTVTSGVNAVKDTVNSVYDAANDIVSGITRPINDIVNAANTEIRTVNQAINGLDNSINGLSDSVHNNSIVRNVNNTLNNINNTARSINNVSNATNNLLDTIQGLPDDLKLDATNYINNKLKQEWVKTGHVIDSCY